ncbi:hypothetical protein JAAARDRAFT_134483 [Jaapia argillacea MUCL 33604]|uniref:Uncharacterized protein n=1 Tax=Jaapia argillacea MUCL 33604 TaxID=933084 RepID=A0A067PLN2_9AGAM|nr:hypothetical protein JAAARDRAFT_134483 [Jaapia argillacea MUCL 33604]
MSPFARPSAAAPTISSPLASSSSRSLGLNRPTPTRNESFARSRPLRPFPSIANSLSHPSSKSSGLSAPGKKPVKLIEPPKRFQGGSFTLNLTQAELSRQD